MCFAQIKLCPLEIKDSPTLRGIKLGMKKSQIETVLEVQLDDKKSYVLLDPEEIGFLLDKSDPTVKKVLDYYKGDMYIEGLKQYLEVPTEARRVFFKPTNVQRNTEKFKDVQNIQLEFFNDKLFTLSIFYDVGKYKDATDKKFYSEIAILLGMPPESLSNYHGLALCKGFTLSATRFTNHITITISIFTISDPLNIRAIQTVKETYEKFRKEQIKERGFKP
jgi:hypothetical protein